MVIREGRMIHDLARFAGQFGRDGPLPDTGPTDPHCDRQAAIREAGIEAAAQAASGRDCVTFGFGDWR